MPVSKSLNYIHSTSSAFSNIQSVPLQSRNPNSLGNIIPQVCFSNNQSPTPPSILFLLRNSKSTILSARLENTTFERGYNFITEKWHYYPRTCYHNLLKQTLSDKKYQNTLVPLHLYGPPCDTSAQV
jgi:hypothetical protein